MTRISELVTIHSGYAQYVNLAQTFSDPTENRDRIEQYMPIKSHREAFTRIARALYPVDDRVYLLTGSYGTGKSHLCLMLANYFALKGEDPEMAAFFHNWRKRDAEGAERLRNLRGEGRYLVAIGEYGLGGDFDNIVLRAMQTAIEREGIADMWLDTHYQEAIRQIERWEGGSSGVFRDFRTQMTERYPGLTLAALKDDLAHFNQEAIKNFGDLYRTVVGREFGYNKDNLIAIVQDFLANPKFKARFKGLVIIADEFGYTLDDGKISLDVFQRFAEFCQNGVAGSQLIFVATAHKAFSSYAAGGLSTSFRVVAARIKEVPLRSEELELIISAMVIPKKEHPVWQSEVLPQAGMFNRFALTASRIGIFKHLKGPELRDRVIENIYPMHPMATHCLIELSTEVGSDARSIFAFFTGARSSNPPEESYPYYVQHTDVKSADRLNLYTADQLVAYFAAELQVDNIKAREAVRQHVRNYHASLREVYKQSQAELISVVDQLVERILRILLVYEISKIAATLDNLTFGLYCEAPDDKKALQNRVTALVKQKVLFQSATGIYEFRRSEATDFEALIDQYKADPENAPANLAEEVVTLVALGRGGEWLEAKTYNQLYTEDKRLRRIFAVPSDLRATYTHKPSGDTLDFFSYQERFIDDKADWKERFEGVIVYVLCESEDDIDRARKAVAINQSARIIVGIPRQPIAIRAAVMNVRAAAHIQKTEDLEAMTLQDRSRLQEEIIGDERRETGYVGALVKARKRYLESRELSWYTTGGSVLVAQPQSEYDPADELMGRLYMQRTIVPHPYLNQIHVARFGPGKDVPLSDAVAALLRTNRPIEIDHNAAANRGEIRYLKNVLADSGALQQTSPPRGTIAAYDVELTLEKFRRKLPVLAAMIERIRTLSQGQTIQVRSLLATYNQPPYGQGPFGLALFLAYVIRTFGDELRLQLQPGAIGYARLDEPDLIIGLVNHEHPNAILERREIRPAERTLINAIHDLFAPQPGAVGQQHTVIDAYSVLRDWWNRQSPLAQASALYPTDTATYRLVQMLHTIVGANPYRFILEQLKAVYGADDDTVITPALQHEIIAGMQHDKTRIEATVGQIKQALIKRLMQRFTSASDAYSDYQQALQEWYRTLGPEQRDEYADWQTPTTRALVKQLRSLTNVETTLFDQLPAEVGFGLGKVEGWSRDRSIEYIEMLHHGIERIEAHRATVAPPEYAIAGTTSNPGQTQFSFRGSTKLTVRPPEVGVKVRITNTGEDPRTAQQFESVEQATELTITATSDMKLVSQAPDGTFGAVIVLSFMNDDTRYRAFPVAQPKLIGELEYRFFLPNDKEALHILLESILQYVMNEGSINHTDVIELLARLRSELETRSS